ncbi:MAG: M4 family metallopeptidase [Bacteroidetes bacterium]|nr:M4 family metallopeptidase [Bacteroidota bacterium]
MRKTFIILAQTLVFAGVSQNSLKEKISTYAENIIESEGKVIYFEMKEAHQPKKADAKAFIESLILENKATLKLLKDEGDFLGNENLRYAVVYNGIKLSDNIIIAHCKNGKLTSINGNLFTPNAPVNSFILTPSAALSYALKKVNAEQYIWQDKQKENFMKIALKDPSFTYYPKAEKSIYTKDNKNYYSYVFNVYATKPLYRANVYVDAATGNILGEAQLIHHTDFPTSGTTKYSGVQTFTMDYTGSLYRFQEAGRGNGIGTFNLNYGTAYGSATDFTNTASTWNITGADQAAADAHWGAEKTYDYYFTKYGRNSIDNAGFQLLSYVHYSSAYNNAFWDGSEMNYGDGDGTTFTILTALDICGHEITHGLTSFTGALNYQNESGALNEGWSDIFGTCIENFGKPLAWNWKIGENATPSGNGIRNMSNPNLFGQPDTYNGTYYYTGTSDNGGVHTNSGVANFWFYLLTSGGTGTNDIGNSYNVSGIGITDAAKIAFRAMTVYFIPTTNFANARALTIQAAKDLFGSCSNQVVQCTNAWYAVGVGAVYAPGVISPNFNSAATSACALPAIINFNNTTAAGLNYTWYFGDGTTSTATNAAHSYTANGTYTVKLKATGCLSGVDSITKSAYITINAPTSPITTGASTCNPGSLILNASGSALLNWYASPSSTTIIGSGSTFTTPVLSSNTTYYVVNTVTSTPSFGGIPSYSATGTSGAYLTNPAQYLIFDVTQPCVIMSALVYAQTAGSRTFEVRDSMGNVLNSFSQNLSIGVNTVNINTSMNPGLSYQLGMNAASTCSLYRTNSGVAYPYNIASCVTLKNSSAGSNPLTYYYWFYNIQVRKADCKSLPVAVTATVLSGSSVSATASSNSVCINASPVSLTGYPAGGTFSGAGVSGSSFNPSIGVGSHSVNYSYTSGSCTSNTIINIMVNALPVVSVSAASSSVCINASAVTLSGSPSGGTYSGAGVSGASFNPSIGTGPHVITYSYTNINNCTNTNTTSIMVNALPTVSASASANNVCLNASNVTLSGAPSGGTFSGAGVSGTAFNPSVGAGTYPVNYSYTNSNNCTNTASLSITVNNLPSVSLTANSTTACTSGLAVNLLGTPSGGTYSGTGVSAGTFNPPASAGNYSMSYSYTDGNGCTNSATTNINVINCVTGMQNNIISSSLKVYPNPNNGLIFVEIPANSQAEIKLLNALGQLILNETLTSTMSTINLINYSSGIYFAEIKIDGNLYKYKLIKN